MDILNLVPILQALNMNYSLEFELVTYLPSIWMFVCSFFMWYSTFKAKIHQIQYQNWIMNNSNVWQPFWIFNPLLVTPYEVIAQMIINSNFFAYETRIVFTLNIPTICCKKWLLPSSRLLAAILKCFLDINFATLWRYVNFLLFSDVWFI